jgi:integrase
MKHLESITPTQVKRTVGRKPNAHYRTREYLFESEVHKLMKAAGDGRHGHRDSTLILLTYRHGLRASEACGLRWEQFDLAHAKVHINRAKKGTTSVHPLTGIELRALRRLQREQEPGRFVFVSERRGPITVAGFRRMLARLGKKIGIPFQIHPHMLRHACGYKLANGGHDTPALQQYLGHSSIQSTVRYTVLRSDLFNGFWKD